MRSVAVLALALLVSACTMLYSRTYVVEPLQPWPPEQRQEVFAAFREFLVKKGLRPLDHGGAPDPDRVAFRIAGTNSEVAFALRHDYEDIIELSYPGGGEFEIRILRIAHQPRDFSEEYLKGFVAQTERYIREATSHDVKLRLAAKNAI